MSQPRRGPARQPVLAPLLPGLHALPHTSWLVPPPGAQGLVLTHAHHLLSQQRPAPSSSWAYLLLQTVHTAPGPTCKAVLSAEARPLSNHRQQETAGTPLAPRKPASSGRPTCGAPHSPGSIPDENPGLHPLLPISWRHPTSGSNPHSTSLHCHPPAKARALPHLEAVQALVPTSCYTFRSAQANDMLALASAPMADSPGTALMR